MIRARSDAPATPTHLRAWRLANAQRWTCALCGRPIMREAKYGSSRGLSLEHVWPKCWGLARRSEGLPTHRGYGFTLAAHGKCNSSRNHNPPTGCELIWLSAVNAVLRRDDPPLTLWSRAPEIVRRAA